MSEEYDDHCNDLDYEQDYEEKQTDEDEEGEFIFFGFISGLFDWLFK